MENSDGMMSVVWGFRQLRRNRVADKRICDRRLS